MSERKRCDKDCKHYLRTLCEGLVVCSPPATEGSIPLQYAMETSAVSEFPYLCKYYEEREERCGAKHPNEPGVYCTKDKDHRGSHVSAETMWEWLVPGPRKSVLEQVEKDFNEKVRHVLWPCPTCQKAKAAVNRMGAVGIDVPFGLRELKTCYDDLRDIFRSMQ